MKSPYAEARQPWTPLTPRKAAAGSGRSPEPLKINTPGPAAGLPAPTFGFPLTAEGADTTPTIPGGRSGNQLPMRRRGGDRRRPGTWLLRHPAPGPIKARQDSQRAAAHSLSGPRSCWPRPLGVWPRPPRAPFANLELGGPAIPIHSLCSPPRALRDICSERNQRGWEVKRSFCGSVQWI